MGLLQEFKSLFNPRPVQAERYDLTVALESDIGCCRLENEDFIHFSLIDNSKQDALAIVADGMGGHAAGETASREAIQAIQKYYLSRRLAENPQKRLKQAVIKANTQVYEISCKDKSLSGMGTTVTALAIVNGFAYYAHVGDSRLYLFRNGNLEQLTQDHTLVQQMLNDGLITEEQAINHPDRNIINRSIGTKPAEEVEVINHPIPVQISDIFLLCSDGLYDLVSDLEIIKIISKFEPVEACQHLIESACSAGGYDNISVIIVKVQSSKILPMKPTITRF
jgi:PPM family protein phosphatase